MQNNCNEYEPTSSLIPPLIKLTKAIMNQQDLENKQRETERQAKEYADNQRALGEKYNQEKEDLAREYTKKLEENKSPSTESFKEQNALYDQLSVEDKSKEITRNSREESLKELQRQDANWQELSKRIDDNKLQASRLKDERVSLTVKSHDKFSDVPSETLNRMAKANAPEAEAAKERIYNEASEKSQNNFSLGNTHTAASDYAEQAKSALSREDHFQRRMESLQTGIEREKDPLAKENLEAKRDLEFHDYKSAQTDKISRMIESPEMSRRSVEHDKMAKEASERIKDTELKMQSREGVKPEEKEKHEADKKDLETVNKQKSLEDDASKKLALENQQEVNKSQIQENKLEGQTLKKEAENPAFLAMQRRIAESNEQQAAAVKKLEEHREKKIEQTKSY